MNSPKASDARLTAKKVVRRPAKLAIYPPTRPPRIAPPERMQAVRAIAGGSDVPTTAFVHGISHWVAAHPPSTGIVPTAIPISVSRNRGGRKTLGGRGVSLPGLA